MLFTFRCKVESVIENPSCGFAAYLAQPDAAIAALGCTASPEEGSFAGLSRKCA